MARQIVEPIKTVIIVLLLASALLLAGKTGVINELRRSMPALIKVEEWIKTFGHSRDINSATGGSVLYEAARPIGIVLTDKNGLHYGAGYDDGALNEMYVKVSKILGEALGSASKPEEITRRQWNEALGNEGVYFDFCGEIPLTVMARWLGLQMINENQHIARRICISGNENDGVDIYYINDNNKFFKCRTAAVLSKITPPEGAYLQIGANYVFELEEDYEGIDPYTLIFRTPPNKYRIRSENLLLDENIRNSVIAAFGINPNSNDKYEKENAVVYVENNGILELFNNGRINYKSDEDNRFFKLQNAGDTTEIGEIIELAREKISLLRQDCEGDEKIYFTGIVEKSDSIFEVTFDYFINGSKIILDGHAATVKIEYGKISEINAYIKKYSLTGEKVKTLPEKQAIASARQLAAGGDLFLVYIDGGAEQIDPEWVCHQ